MGTGLSSHSATHQASALNLEQKANRRHAILGATTALMGSLGVISLGKVIGEDDPPVPQAAAREISATPTPAPTLVPFFIQDEVDTVAQQFARLGTFRDPALPQVDLRDLVVREIELPFAYARAAIDAITVERRDGTLLAALANFYRFHQRAMLPDDDATRAVYDAYNPYTYVPSAIYDPHQRLMAQKMVDPNGLYAAIVTTWRTAPDALVSHFDAMTLVASTPQHDGVGTVTMVSSREKQTVRDATVAALELTKRLIDPAEGEGAGPVSEELKVIAPRFYRVSVGMALS